MILGGGDDACPVWEKDALHTASSWPRSVMISWPVVTSQRRAVQSSEAVAIRAPSGQKDALDSAPSWPRSAMISWPVVACQRRAVRSSEGGDDARPVGGKGRAQHRVLMAAQHDDLLAGCRVPQSRRAVSGGGDDTPPFGGEGRTRTWSWCPTRRRRSAPGGVRLGQRGAGEKSGSCCAEATIPATDSWTRPPSRP